MPTYRLLPLVIGFIAWLSGSSQQLVSVSTAGGPGYDWGKQILPDTQGNLIATGIFESGCLMSGVPIPCYGATDAYLMKMDPNGQLLWLRHWGGPQPDYSGGLTMDEEDNIYVSGQARGNFQLMDTMFEAEGESDVFIAKFSSEGTMLWLKSIVGPGNAHSRCLAYHDGHLFAGGTFDSTAVFMGDTLQAAGESDTYLAALDTNGVLEWWHAYGGPTEEKLVDVTVADNGQVNAVISFDDSLSFGDTVYTTFGSTDFIVGCWNTDGSILWASHIYTGGGDLPFAIASDDDGSTYTLSTFLGWTDLDPLYFSSYHDLMILKLDPTGQPVWAKYGDGVNNFVGQDIAVGWDHHAFISARFQYSATFDGVTLAGTEPYMDIGVFVELDENGSLQWIAQSTGSGSCHPEDLLQLPDGDILATGMFSGTVQFIDTVVQGVGSNDIFFLRLTDDGQVGLSEPGGSTTADLFALSPVPASDRIVISVPRIGFGATAEFEIMDVTGRQCLSQSLRSANTTVQLDLPGGSYIARLGMDGRTTSRRFVIE